MVQCSYMCYMCVCEWDIITHALLHVHVTKGQGYMCMSRKDRVTCACHERTGLHVHVTRGQGYTCMSREDRVTRACHERTGLHVHVTRGQGGLLHITQFLRKIRKSR